MFDVSRVHTTSKVLVSFSKQNCLTFTRASSQIERYHATKVMVADHMPSLG